VAALLGDSNLDGKVNIIDLGNLANYYYYEGNPKVGDEWEEGDFNQDGKVTILDLGDLANNYGASIVGAGIPEPGTLCLLALGCLALIRRRRA